MKEDLKSVANLVKAILISDERARNDDNYLFHGEPLYISAHCFFGNFSEFDFPAFESVRRSRQRVQAAYPELGADRKIKGFRNSNEAEYKAFATEPCLFCEDVKTVCPECGKGVQNG